MAENQEGGTAQESGGYDYKRLHSYPLIRVSWRGIESHSQYGGTTVVVVMVNVFRLNHSVTRGLDISPHTLFSVFGYEWWNADWSDGALCNSLWKVFNE